jgi:hypothetical protein
MVAGDASRRRMQRTFPCRTNSTIALYAFRARHGYASKKIG